jgi:hypothetical protein
MGVVFLLLIAVGILLSEDLRSNGWALAFAGFVFLGALGLAWSKWRDFQAREAVIDTERNTRR